MGTKNWRENVYRRPLNDTDYYNSQEWKQLRSQARKRAKYRCERCGRGGKLTVHHILSRDLGGPDILENLIALCTRCHDYVHANIDHLVSRDLIIGSILKDIEIIKKTDLEDDGEDEFARYHKSWHAWVYGGTRNPNMDK